MWANIAYFLKAVVNHVHFRNVVVQKPNERYTEVFVDEGDNDMFAVMRELVRQKYTLQIYPEHPRALAYDQWAGIRSQYAGGEVMPGSRTTSVTRARCCRPR
jgi:mannonate dehydratase